MAAYTCLAVLSMVLLSVAVQASSCYFDAQEDRRCQELERQLRRCSGSRQPSEQCCCLAERYDCECQDSSSRGKRPDIGREILDRCRPEEDVEEFFSVDNTAEFYKIRKYAGVGF